MYNQIKAAAEAAINLQNKNGMEAALKRIVGLCDEAIVSVKIADRVPGVAEPSRHGSAPAKKGSK